MDESKRDQGKSKRSKSDHIRNVVNSYLQKRNYASTSASVENISPQQQITYSSVETAISKPNSILYSCYNSDPVVIDHNFTKFAAWVRDSIKNKNQCHDIEYIIGPLFCHLYLDVLRGGNSDKAATFYKSHLPAIDKTKCDDFVKELVGLLTSDSESAILMKEEYRNHKYYIELTAESVAALKKFVAEHCHVVILQILQNWFDIEEIDDTDNESIVEVEEEEEEEGAHAQKMEEPLEDSPKVNGDDNKDDKFQKLRDILKELEKEPKQVFIAQIANVKEPVTCGLIRRSCGLIAYNQINILKLRSVSQCDSVLGRDCEEIEFVHHSKQIYALALSENNALLASGSADKTVAIYDLNKMELVRMCEGHIGPVYCVAISGNSAYIGSGSQDTTARLWSSREGATLRIFAGHTSAVTCLDFHPNCLYLATGSSDRNLRLWSIDNGSPLRLFHGSKGVIYSVLFSPSGDTLISGSEDRKLRIWDVLTSKISTEIRVKGAPITKIACSNDSKLICGCSSDGNVKIWDLNPNAETDGSNKSEPIQNLTVRGKLFAVEYSFGTFACLTSRLQSDESHPS